MNMKKSIAGVMAGAMAVSAMAAVVSADQDAISLTYDLKTYVNNVNKNAAKVTVVANYEGSRISQKSLELGYVTFGADNGFVRSGDIFNDKGVKVGEVPYDNNKKGAAAMKEFEFTARPYKDLVNNVEEKYQTFKATNYANNVNGAYYDKNLGKAEYNMPIATGSNVYGAFDLSKYDLLVLGYSTGDNALPIDFATVVQDDKAVYGKDGDIAIEYKDVNDAATKNVAIKEYNEGKEASEKLELIKEKYEWVLADKYKALGVTFTVSDDGKKITSISDPSKVLKYNGVTKSTYAVRDAVAKMTYEVPNTVSLNKADGWGWGGSNWPHLTEAELEDTFKHFFNTSMYGDVTMSAENFAKGFWNSWGGKKGLIYSDTTLVSDPTTVAVGAFEAGSAEEAVIPFKTTLNPGSKKWEIVDAKGVKSYITTKENDVIYALQNRKAGGNYYTKPLAVLNDAIANHTNVTFTFTSYDGYVGTFKSHAMTQWVNEDQGYGYKTSDFDWHNPTFGQHLYTNIKDSYSLFDTDDYDMEGSYRDPDGNLAYGATNWGFNLFTGAVVVNNQITMQLSDVDTFNWGSNTLTFDWFDITDDGRITDAKTFLTSMLLYTPVDWYWDKLTVVVTDEDREDIDAGEGLEGDGEVLEDEPEVEEPEIVEEPEVEETEAETEAEPVETAPSPATGNAPVALAVIPVALAAAAVVAKKRG